MKIAVFAVAAIAAAVLIVGQPVPSGAVTGLTVGSASPVTPFTPLAQPGDRPAVAFNGTSFLTAWSSAGSASSAQFSPSGTAQSASSFAPAYLDDSGLEQDYTLDGLAAAGSRYGAAVTRVIGGPFGGGVDSYVQVLGTDHTFQPPAGCAGIDTIVVAGASTTFLAVWTDECTGDLDAQVLDRNASPIGPTRVLAAGAGSGSFQAAGHGHQFLVAWQTDTGDPTAKLDVRGIRVADTGSIVGHAFPVAAHAQDQFSPSVSAGGSGYLVTYADRRNSTDPDIYATRVGTNGAVTDPNGIAVSKAAGSQNHPWAAPLGTNGWQVVWSDRRSGVGADLYGTVLSSAGVVASPAGRALVTAAGDQTAPVVAALPTGSVVVWADGPTHRSMLQRLSAGGAITGSPAAASITNAPQTSLATASGGGVELAVWIEQRTSQRLLRASRLG
ncbi:MAG: hypothetical protein JOY78_13250, partial [Pseudonocardia sp.]|nr:hypothetical protein [Pseudonocardia sp.]